MSTDTDTKAKPGRPRKWDDPVARTISLEGREWDRLARMSPPARSWADRLRGLLSIAKRIRKKDLRKVQRAWRAKLTDPPLVMADKVARTVRADSTEWDTIEELAPWGSWPMRVRQLIEMARIVKKHERAKAKSEA